MTVSYVLTENLLKAIHAAATKRPGPTIDVLLNLQAEMNKNRVYDGVPLTDFARLEGLRDKVSEDPLHESGRHFVGGFSYSNLTSCHHGDTGEFHNGKNGEAIALLWNLWKSGQLIVRPSE